MVTSNSVTLRLFGLAEQCHTQHFYSRCFKLDFDALKSKSRWPQNMKMPSQMKMAYKIETAHKIKRRAKQATILTLWGGPLQSKEFHNDAVHSYQYSWLENGGFLYPSLINNLLILQIDCNSLSCRLIFVVRRSHDVARLHLMSPTDFWWNCLALAEVENWKWFQPPTQPTTTQHQDLKFIAGHEFGSQKFLPERNLALKYHYRSWTFSTLVLLMFDKGAIFWQNFSAFGPWGNPIDS